MITGYWPRCQTGETMSVEGVMHPMITEPVYHGISLEIPAQLRGNRLAHLGYIDVTDTPFFADPSGTRDATRAIQDAVRLARNSQMVAFFPVGTYRISDTIECVQEYYSWRSDKVMGARHHPCVLVGSQKDPGKRAVILLAPSSPGYESADSPKYVIHFWARGAYQHWEDGRAVMNLRPDTDKASINMNQLFIGIDVTIGEDNPGAIAVRHKAAQGSGIQDCTIVATHGYKGVEGGAGSGGGHFNVTVKGGRIGMDLTEAQPAGTVCGVRLEGQTECALRYDGGQTLCVVGCHIRPAPGSRALQCGMAGHDNPFLGHMVVADSAIEYPVHGGDIAAITTARSIFLSNVYVKNACRVLEVNGSCRIRGGSNGWLHIKEYAQGGLPLSHPHLHDVVYRFPVYFNREKGDCRFAVDHASPPATLVSAHTWPASLPTFETPGVVNIREAPYNAKGNGVDDDTRAIQEAIDNHSDVFIPKGHYRISAAVKLKPDTRIFGIHPLFSNMFADGPGAYFSDVSDPAPACITADSAAGSAYLGFFSVTIPRHLQQAYALHHACGGETVIRTCRFGFHHTSADERDKVRDREWGHPLVVVSGNAGGKWYMHYEEQPIQGSNYRHLLLKDVKGPLTFYQLNTEHASADAQFEIARSRGIAVYGFKTERNSVVIRVSDSENIRFFGYGGNATALPGRVLIDIIDSRSILLSGLIDQGRTSGAGFANVFGCGVNPKEWSFIQERKGPVDFTVEPCERPAYYYSE